MERNNILIMKKLLYILFLFTPYLAFSQGTRTSYDTIKVTYLKPLRATAKIYLSDTLVLKDGTKQVTALTNTLKSNWNTAYSLSHNHTNYSALNVITSSGDGTQYLANDGTYKTVSVGTSQTASQIRDSLQALTGANRLDVGAVKRINQIITMPGTFKIPFNSLNTTIVPYALTGNITFDIDTAKAFSGGKDIIQIYNATGNAYTAYWPLTKFSPASGSTVIDSFSMSPNMVATFTVEQLGSPPNAIYLYCLIGSKLVAGIPIQLAPMSNFQSTSFSSSQINLSWSLPTIPGRNFQIYDSIGGVSSYKTLLVSPAKTATSYNHTGLSNSQHVYYWGRNVGNGTDTLTSIYATADATTSSIPSYTNTKSYSVNTGNNDITIPTSTSLDFGNGSIDNKILISVWFKRVGSSTGGNHTIIQRGANDGSHLSFVMRVDNSNIVYFGISDNVALKYKQVKTSAISAIGNNEWVHLLAYYDGSKTIAGFKIDVNGSNQTLSTVADDAGYNAMRVNLYPTYIGKWVDGTTSNCLIDNLAIYKDVTLTSGIESELYPTPALPVNHKGTSIASYLISWWDFNDNLIDNQSGNNGSAITPSYSSTIKN